MPGAMDLALRPVLQHVAFRPDEGQSPITRLRVWMEAHTDQAIVIVSLGLGLWLVANSVYLLVS